MPKVSLGKPNYELIFGAKLKSAIIENRLECETTAKRLGITGRTMSNRFKQPSFMTLGQLKLFIKITNLPRDAVINYLYEEKAL